MKPSPFLRVLPVLALLICPLAARAQNPTATPANVNPFLDEDSNTGSNTNALRAALLKYIYSSPRLSLHFKSDGTAENGPDTYRWSIKGERTVILTNEPKMVNGHMWPRVRITLSFNADYTIFTANGGGVDGEGRQGAAVGK